MSDVTYNGYEELADRVDEARRTWGRTYVTENLLKFVTLFGGGLLLFSALGGIVSLPAVGQWTILTVLAVLLLGGAAWFVFRPLFRVWTDEEVAVHVESKFPEINNALINSLQLANDRTVREPRFVSRLIDHAARDTRAIRFADAIDRRALVRFGASAGVIVLCLALYAALFGSAFERGIRQILLLPTLDAAADEADHASIEIQVDPGDKEVIAGDSQAIKVRYRIAEPVRVEDVAQEPDAPVEPAGAEADTEITATLTYTVDGADEDTVDMEALDDGGFTYTFREIRIPRNYHVTVGGTRSSEYRITVTHPPAVTRIDVEYTYPLYTRLLPQTEQESNGDVRGPVGTEAKVSVTVDKPIDSGSILGYGTHIPLEPADRGDRRVLHGTIRVKDNGSYRFRIKDTTGIENRSPIIHRITALPDRRPDVRITTPGQKTVLKPGGKVNVEFRATDDYGIVKAELVARREHSKDEKGSAVASWTTFLDPCNVQKVHTWRFDAKDYKPGQAVEYRVRVTDNRSTCWTHTGQANQTPWYRIEIEDKNKIAERKVTRMKGWEGRLRKVLEQEIGIRATAAAMEKPADAARFIAMASAVTKDQADARLAVLSIAGNIKPSDPNLRVIRDRLYNLGRNTLWRAVKHGENMNQLALSAENKAKPEERRNEKAKAVVELQAFEKEVDKAIALIREILRVLPELQEQVKKEKDEDEGFDLSEDAKDTLKELARGLKDFIEEQKKVVDATQELAQKNVDDFTKEDDRKLKDLAATEDKWAQFFVEKHNDLSKLPEQDLANSTLLKELLEVQSEVQMAKDALSKKAKEIATAIEDNGLELAKKLETHIEKWLPDEPDRKQWKMEETLGEGEAPMAELPKELEDLVGDLMEEEEDLMDEVEDATAGYADSLDKGAGWEAADGPISNMSAQGVTGNTLPNKSEIGGRSGEGRSGKSSGEFVEESATGKGGRKTPTRLTPDAYEKGQVNDSSKDPMGGSTGGGKASGAGAGGLEGPIPPQIEAKLKSLAVRQAELRNKAEKVNAKFKVMSWPSPFEDTIKHMRKIEVDLRNARYRNVLRRRPIVLRNLKGTRTFLEERIKVRKDYSTALPNYLQDEILDATQGGTPRGYERLLKDYHKSISKPKK